MTPEIKELFDERFDHLYDKMNSQHESMQNMMHNMSAQVEKIDNKTEKLQDTLQGMIIKDVGHFLICPNTKSIKDINTKIEEYKKEVNSKLSETRQDLYTKWDNFKKEINIMIQDIAFFVRNPKVLTWILFGWFVINAFIVYEVYQKIVTVDHDLKQHEFFQRQSKQDTEIESILRGGERDPTKDPGFNPKDTQLTKGVPRVPYPTSLKK